MHNLTLNHQLDRLLLVIPMITQSDPGSKNVRIAYAQTVLRQMHDPTLEGFVQHKWMRTKNVKRPLGRAADKLHVTHVTQELMRLLLEESKAPRGEDQSSVSNDYIAIQ